MSLVVDNRRFYCTTSDVWFGPVFGSDEQGDKFSQWLYANGCGDARQYSESKLVQMFEIFKIEVQHV